MERTEKFEEIINQAGLNWSVRSEEIETKSGIIIPKHIALIREDTNGILGLHKDGYSMYQNDELLELLFAISTHTGLELKGGGMFDEGKKVFFQLKSLDLDLNGDRIEGSITGINSFDGSTSLSFGNSNKTISCRNTFFMVYKTLTSKFRHSATMRSRVEEVLKQIGHLVEEEKKTFKTIERMANVRMDAGVRELVTRMMFDIKKEDSLASDEFSTNKKNRMAKFGFDLDGEISQKGDNLWGLFSGVTKYTTHSMKKGDNSENKIFGRTGILERDIFSALETRAFA